MLRHAHPDRPALITTAPESPDDEFDRRRKRYAIMMAVRAACVIAAALTYRESIILALLFLAGGAIIPWCAVLIANDRPRKRHASRFGHVPSGERQLPPGTSEHHTVE